MKIKLCFAVSLLSLITFCGCGKTDTSAQTTASVATIATTVAADTITEISSATTDCKASSDISLTVNKEESWQSGDKICTKFSVPLKNTTGKPLTDWSVEIEFSESVSISDMWNGKYTVSGNTLKITAMDYNTTINSGDTTEIGFIGEFTSSPEIVSSKLYENGNVVETSSEVQESSSQNEVTANMYSPEKGSPAEQNGKLSVKGTQLVNEAGEPIILQGVSTHGIAWFPQYINKEAFQTLRDDMGVDTIRLALYSSSDEGYSKALHSKVDEGVKYASELGMYTILDWHILEHGNPNTDKENAKLFFDEMSKKYSSYNNIIYEICNEPNGNVSWANDIKPYAEEIIPVIRNNDPSAVIIVGTPTWSQDVDVVANDPLSYDNVMYALHFYASTHKQDLRNKLETAYNKGLPIFVSEFGICDASGNGNIDENEANTWIEFLRKRGISYVCWNLSNKAEASALIESSCDKTGYWTDDDLSEEGKWLKKTYTSK